MVSSAVGVSPVEFFRVVGRAPVFEVCAEVVLIPVGVSGVHHGLKGLSVLMGLSGGELLPVRRA